MKIVVKSEVQEEMTSAFEQNEQMNEVSNALTTFGGNDMLMNNSTIVRSFRTSTHVYYLEGTNWSESEEKIKKGDWEWIFGKINIIIFEIFS
uniref:Uncharacterized protein n=1 Tax=Meloidogyne incognita TaxID=6306 RepID=A0A914MDZ4_MELIC